MALNEAWANGQTFNPSDENSIAAAVNNVTYDNADGVAVGNGTGAPTIVSPGAIDNVLRSDGTLWGSGSVTTFMGQPFESRKLMRNTILTASTDLAALESIEIPAAYSLEIPATSTLEVLAVGALPTPGAVGNIPVSNGTSWTTTAQNPTRTGVYQFEHCNGFISWGQSVTFNERRPFILPRTTAGQGFRLHWKNTNFLGDASPTGSLINCVAYIGIAAVDANGDMTGQFSDTPTQLTFSSGTTITGAGELISDWVPPTTRTMLTNVKYILSVGNQTSGTTEQYAQGGGAYWYTITAGLVTQTAGAAAPALTRADNQGYFELYLEYEFADITAPVGLIVSNSLSWNTNQASLVNRGEIDTWHQLWARASGGIAANIAVSGATTAHYNATSPKWSHYNTLNTPLDLDFILYWEAFSNDLGGTTTDAAGRAAIQAATITMILKGQALYPNARHIVTTNAPRGDITGSAMVVDTMEYCRDLLNTWISNNPCGVDQCLDPETEITNGADPARQKREVYGDGTHRSPRGNARLSKLLPTKRNL